MKLKSGREYKNDLSDIIGILAEHEKRGEYLSFEMISSAVADLYGSFEAIGEKSLNFIKSVLENKKYDEIYGLLRENEINTKSVLIDFDKKYPGVLGADNVDSIIEGAEKKKESKASLRELLEKKKNNKDAE